MLVRDGVVLARGWTQPGGRPHAEAMALEVAGPAARGATLYVSLEPCDHQSPRGPACADLVAASGVARVVAGCADPDPRTAGQGLARIAAAGIAAELLPSSECLSGLAGYLSLRQRGRPLVTLKLATSLDGAIALGNGQSQWITGAEARAHCHAWRARHQAILVGGGTLHTDQPRLDVRLPGLESRSPQRWVLTSGSAPHGWHALPTPSAITEMANVQTLFVEGGAQTAAAFLRAGLVDRLLLYRAPIVIGGGLPCLTDLGLTALDQAHGQWRLTDSGQLGKDRFELYEHC